MSLIQRLLGLTSTNKKPLVRLDLVDQTLNTPTQAKPMEERTEIKTYEVDRTCSVCGTGKMRPFGDGQMGNLHEHVCSSPSCSFRELIQGKRYPYIITERVTTQPESK